MNRFRCQQFQERLNDLLDRRVSPRSDSMLARHAETCQECDRWLDTQELVLGALSFSGPTTVGHRSTKVRIWVNLAAVAALVSICLFSGRHWLRTPVSYEVASVDPYTTLPEVAKGPGVSVAADEIASQFDGAVESWNEFLANTTVNTEWLEPVATPIRPLAHSMTSTFNVLRQAIPTGRRSQKPDMNVQESAARFMAISTVA